MAEVSVREFSETVGTPIERLLVQLGEAGLPHAAEADLLSDQDKERLLSYLRRVHGKDEEGTGRSPRKKITLKRRQVSEISIAPSPRETRGPGGRIAARKRTVKVDVLRSRTYARPADESAGPTGEALREQEAAKSHLVEEARAHRRTLDERLRTDNEARAEEEVRRSGSASASWPRQGRTKKRPGQKRKPPGRLGPPLPKRPANRPRRPSRRRPPRPPSPNRPRPPPKRGRNRPARIRPALLDGSRAGATLERASARGARTAESCTCAPIGADGADRARGASSGGPSPPRPSISSNARPDP